MAWGGGDRYEDRGCHLLLVDIRKEHIYWEKEIPDNTSEHEMDLNAILDSVLFFISMSRGSDRIHKIAVRILGDENFQHSRQVYLKPKKIDIKDKGMEYPIGTRIRPWKDGLILLNNYALIDTVAGTIESWQPSGEFEWLNECSDAKWSSVGGLCLKEIPDTLGFVLLRNGVDTLAVRYMTYKLPESEEGNFRRELVFSGNSIISRGWIYLINGQGQVSENPLDTWVWSQTGYYFRDFHGNEINYNKKILH